MNLVTFDPVGRFFFGSAHGYDDTYLIRSQKQAPLSTVLGTIRKSILLQEGLLTFTSNGARVTEGVTTGKSVADIEATIGDFDYAKQPLGSIGKIKSISPVFLVRRSDRKIFYPLPLNWQETNEGYIRRPLQTQEGVLNNFNGTQSEYFHSLQAYSAKLGLSTIWAESSKWKAIAEGSLTPKEASDDFYRDEDIYIETKHPGISRGGKRTDGRTEFTQSSASQSYFQKIDYSFKDDGFLFGVFVDFLPDFKLNTCGVEMGGDRSFFQMSASEVALESSDELIRSLVTPIESLDSNSKYVVLSESNLLSTRGMNYTCFNGGSYDLLRRLKLFRNAGTSDSPYRQKMKGAVIKNSPKGSIIVTNNDALEIKPNVNQSAGYDRFIKIQ